jgi:hypothetical protein
VQREADEHLLALAQVLHEVSRRDLAGRLERGPLVPACPLVGGLDQLTVRSQSIECGKMMRGVATNKVQSPTLKIASEKLNVLMAAKVVEEDVVVDKVPLERLHECLA